MKSLINKGVFKNIKTKATILAMAAAGFPMTAYAADELMRKVKPLIELIASVFPAVGVFFILLGAWKLFQAFRTDQPDAQAGAAKDIVIGVVFVVFKTFAMPTILSMM